MMRHYEEIGQFERDGFTIVVDKTWEDIDPWSQLNECFDDRDELYRKINDGDLEWFMLRVRAMLNGHELAAKYLGGCLYDWNKVADVLTDGTVEDCLLEVLPEARVEALQLIRALQTALDTETV
jgi:hypothetical protein